MKDLYGLIKSETLDFLRASPKRLSPEELKEFIEDVIKTKTRWLPGQTVDSEALYRDIASVFSVWSGDETILDNNNEDHQVWLSEQQSRIKWKLWNRYFDYLIKEQGLPPLVVEKTDILTHKILERLENPIRPGSWDRRGMVAGDVQSGKTSNFTGLICKCADAGYKVIIVLSGMTDDLRSQTQKRLDLGFLGYDSSKRDNADQSETRIGVGELSEHESVVVHSVTSGEKNGDFSKKVFKAVNVRLGGDSPVLFVVKKNASVLNNLLGELTRYSSNGKIKNIPLLMIDDEADSASIDGKAVERDEKGKPLKDQDPSTINGLIRKILNLFAQSAYVGYTATPFANIFIFPRTENDKEKFGEDLFPRSFIINLPTPDNYIGPSKVFGINRTGEEGEKKKGLPIVKLISDYGKVLPKSHKKDLIVTCLPDTLLKAIKYFVLACAAREARGQVKKHNSMLIHVTRLNDVQAQVYDLVEHELRRLQRTISLGTGKVIEDLYSELHTSWVEEFDKHYEEICQSVNDLQLTKLTWEMVKECLPHATAKIEVRIVNKDSTDGGLNYDDYKDGASFIAIGGDKLSRGLTLEGLSISYYTRASKMYDTLLQMGRWFGYKSGFLDLCRLFTSSELKAWYEHITVANEELKKEFDYMAKQNANPEQYGLRVRTHPNGLLITSTNKMRNTKDMEVGFAHHLVETVRFYKKDPMNESNYIKTEAWLKKLKKPVQVPGDGYSGHYKWEGVSGDEIIEFLSGYMTHPLNMNAYPPFLQDYITTQMNKNELVDWTVALISSRTGKQVINFGGYPVKLPIRTVDIGDKEDDLIMLSRNHMITQSHESIDLEENQIKLAMDATISDWEQSPKTKEKPKNPSPLQIRKQRDKTKGLLLIYPLYIEPEDVNCDNPIIAFAISFPESPNAARVKYKANNTYWRNMYESEE